MADLVVFDVDAPVDVPLCPPESWFTEVPSSFDPRDGLIQIELDGPDEGRVVALVAPEGERILRDDIDWQTPQSPTGYEFAHAGTTLTAEGSKVRTANIGGNINHAPPSYAMRAAIDLYANTATRTIRCRYHDVPGVGVVAAGALWPGLSRRDAITAMGMAISGDWRHVASLGSHDLAGSQLVNAPALRPLPHGVSRHESYRPARFLPVAASLTDNPTDVVFGGWVGDEGDGPSFGERLTVLETAVAHLMVAATPHVGLDDDHSDVFNEVYGCKACQSHGCPYCDGTGVARHDPLDDMVGYDVSDEFPDGVPTARWDPLDDQPEFHVADIPMVHA